MLNSINPCSSRRPGDAVGACCAARRTLRCDGKLLSPERRCAAKRTTRCDRAVVVLQDRFRVSQRRACRLTGEDRNAQRRPVPLADIEKQKLRSRIRELARSHVRWGRWLVYRRLRVEGWEVNHKCNGSGVRKGCSAPCRASGNAHGHRTAPERC